MPSSSFPSHHSRTGTSISFPFFEFCQFWRESQLQCKRPTWERV